MFGTFTHQVHFAPWSHGPLALYFEAEYTVAAELAEKAGDAQLLASAAYFFMSVQRSIVVEDVCS